MSNMCIYLGDKILNIEKSEEHIFPACIGGIRKLSNQDVSAEANRIFKPLEDKFAHQSEIQLTRSFYGPGKRGSKKPNETPIVVMYDKVRNCNELGYLFFGKIYSIPQVLIDEETKTFSFTSMELTEQSAKIAADSLFEKLSKFDVFNNKFVYLQIETENSKPDIIVGISNKKVIVSSHCLREDLDLAKIDKILKSFADVTYSDTTTRTLENPKIAMHAAVTNDTNRVFAKIAFNCLCFHKGANFVNNKVFDEFRQWIITGEGHSDNWINEDVIQTPEIVSIFPQHSHWCLLTVADKNVCAIVCLYGSWTRKYVLGTLPENESLSLLGYICDYQTNVEYTLSEYIEAFARENHKRLEENNE